MFTKERIIEILIHHFHPTELIVRDDSHQHAGHNPSARSGNTHYSIEIVSETFKGKKLVERHRLIYAALEDGLKTHIHALAIKAFTPEEFHKF